MAKNFAAAAGVLEAAISLEKNSSLVILAIWETILTPTAPAI